jgi:hypothetical protein
MTRAFVPDSHPDGDGDGANASVAVRPADQSPDDVDRLPIPRSPLRGSAEAFDAIADACLRAIAPCAPERLVSRP